MHELWLDVLYTVQCAWSLATSVLDIPSTLTFNIAHLTYKAMGTTFYVLSYDAVWAEIWSHHLHNDATIAGQKGPTAISNILKRTDPPLLQSSCATSKNICIQYLWKEEWLATVPRHSTFLHISKVKNNGLIYPT